MKSRSRCSPWLVVSLFLGGVLGVWLAGFAWFIFDAWRPPRIPPSSDGIVALTGGNGRVEASLRLLRHDSGHLLLISGVDPHVTLADLGPALPPALADRVTLGRRATSTAGNAVETTGWVRENDIHSLIVVTAGYHIRRAMLEISRALPDVTLHAYAVQSPALRRPFDRKTFHLLALEYNKLLLAFAGPVSFFRHSSDAF
ncbi:YdcF family protein [Acetobacter fallax]|nr:YdcF family protein [Acetobacter fallax]